MMKWYKCIDSRIKNGDIVRTADWLVVNEYKTERHELPQVRNYTEVRKLVNSRKIKPWTLGKVIAVGENLNTAKIAFLN